MATTQLTANTLTVKLSTGEKIAGLLRDVEVPLTAVREVEVTADPLTAMRGLRAPGLALPGVRKVGTWRARGERTMVCVRRGQPAVRVRLDGQQFDTLLIGDDDAAALAARITEAVR
jgi:hypothetical protein